MCIIHYVRTLSVCLPASLQFDWQSWRHVTITRLANIHSSINHYDLDPPYCRGEAYSDLYRGQWQYTVPRTLLHARLVAICRLSRVSGSGWGASVFTPVCRLDCSLLFFSSPRSEGGPHHGRNFSIYFCPLSFWLTLTPGLDCPVHVLMLSIQAVLGLPRLPAPGIVPCITFFSRQRPCFVISKCRCKNFAVLKRFVRTLCRVTQLKQQK